MGRRAGNWNSSWAWNPRFRQAQPKFKTETLSPLDHECGHAAVSSMRASGPHLFHVVESTIKFKAPPSNHGCNNHTLGSPHLTLVISFPDYHQICFRLGFQDPYVSINYFRILHSTFNSHRQIFSNS